MDHSIAKWWWRYQLLPTVIAPSIWKKPKSHSGIYRYSSFCEVERLVKLWVSFYASAHHAFLCVWFTNMICYTQ
uniref:Uncharacterized protein n=1 Tax=Populus trichocarpa TaxID=3694 RepID=B9ILC3_POPTR